MTKKVDWVLSKNMEAYLLFAQLCVLVSCLYYVLEAPTEEFISKVILVLYGNAVGTYYVAVMLWSIDWRERYIPLAVLSIIFTTLLVLLLFI